MHVALSHMVTPSPSGQTSSLQWEVADPSTDVVPTLPPFTKPHGPWVTLGTEASPLNFFSLFFDDCVLDLLVEETNRLVEYKYYCSKYTYLHTCIHIQLCRWQNPNPAALGEPNNSQPLPKMESRDKAGNERVLFGSDQYGDHQASRYWVLLEDFVD